MGIFAVCVVAVGDKALDLFEGGVEIEVEARSRCSFQVASCLVDTISLQLQYEYDGEVLSDC